MGGKLPPACGVPTVSPRQMSTFSWGGKKERPLKRTGNLFPYFPLCQPWPKCYSVVCHRLALLLSLWQSAPVVNVFVYVHKSEAAHGWMTPNLHVAGLPLVWREMGTCLLPLNQTSLIDPPLYCFTHTHSLTLLLTDTRRNTSPTSPSSRNSYKDVFKRHAKCWGRLKAWQVDSWP